MHKEFEDTKEVISGRKTVEVMTSIPLRGTLGSVASFLGATLYQGNPDRNHNL
jgi:hypothetical protein